MECRADSLEALELLVMVALEEEEPVREPVVRLSKKWTKERKWISILITLPVELGMIPYLVWMCVVL